MTDLSVIILTKNEQLHIKRCLERLLPLEPRQIFIVDCFSTDGTQSLARQYWENRSDLFSHLQNDKTGQTYFIISVVEHEWPGNQAAQFNWALDNLPVDTEWILRLDADEWLTDELIAEIKDKLQTLPDDVDGVVLKRRHYVGWLGSKWIKHGMYPTRILRLFRTGHARYAEDMAMDEHLVVKGKTVEFNNDFVDESLISFGDWKAKHRNYAKREAQMAMSSTANANKKMYYKMPPYLRAFAYFCYRYFFRLGFLDGYAGWMWHLYHGLWYRLLVDREIANMKSHSQMRI